MKQIIHSAKYSETAKTIGAHHHDAHQILYVTDGSAQITVNGEIFNLSRGSLIFISRMETHSIVEASADYKRFEIRIPPEVITTDVKNARLYSVLLNRPQGFNRVINLPPEQVSPLFDQIISEQKSDFAHKSEMQSALLEILFIKIYRLYPQLFSITETPAFTIVQKIQGQFEKDITEKYTLDDLSHQYHISKYYLAHIFKDITGYAIMDYLKSLRIAKAKNLLTKSDSSITEIVKNCGFSDSSNFSREFKSITSQTPSEFRKNQRKPS